MEVRGRLGCVRCMMDHLLGEILPYYYSTRGNENIGSYKCTTVYPSLNIDGKDKMKGSERVKSTKSFSEEKGNTVVHALMVF